MRALSLLAPVLLAACTGVAVAPEGPAAPALPPQVAAALPAGVPASVVTRTPEGCYLITLERTDPPSGYPLTDAGGNRVCEGATVLVPAGTTPT
jgi:hypothetical protein